MWEESITKILFYKGNLKERLCLCFIFIYCTKYADAECEPSKITE